MPNHIKNRVIINSTPENVEKVFSQFNTHYKASIRKAWDGKAICKNKENSIGWLDLTTGEFHQRDKEIIIGLPSGFEIEIIPSYDYFPDFEKIIAPPDCPEYRDEPSQEAVINHKNNWYNWNIKNWGTKWNSYSHEKESFNTFSFETAWSGVPNLIQVMSIQFPGIEFDYEYSDEDTGYNCGSYKFLNGKIVESFIPDGGSKESYDLAFKLRPGLM